MGDKIYFSKNFLVNKGQQCNFTKNICQLFTFARPFDLLLCQPEFKALLSTTTIRDFAERLATFHEDYTK